MGLCEGPIADITAVWVNSKQFTGGNGVALRKAGLSMATGAIGQAVWSYLTSNFPTQAIGYSGLCIVYASNYPLDSSAATPNHVFEVASTIRLAALNLPDANPKDIVTDFFTNGRYGLPSWAPGLLDQPTLDDWGNYCLAANLVLSPCLDQAQTGAAFLTEVFLASNSTCVWSEGRLKFIPYGDTQITGNGVTWAPNLTPAYALDSRNFIPSADGDDPLTVDLQDQSDAYNIVQLEYLDRNSQYNTAIATAQDLANIDQYGRRKKNPTTVHSICTPAVAQAAAQLYLQRTLYVRAQYKFDLDWSFALLEPGDIVEITDPGAGLNAYPVRITQIDDDENTRRSVTAEDLLAGVSHAPLYNNQEGLGYASNRSIDPGGVEANLLLWSEDLTNPVYGHFGATISANAAADPLFGALTADMIVAGASNGFHNTAQNFACFEEVAYCFSAYFKPAGRRIGVLQILDAASNGVTLYFDCEAGTVFSPAVANGNALNVDGTVVSAGAGWCRVSVIVTLPTATTATAIVDVCDDSGNPVWSGDGSSGLYSWGWQVKQGVDVPQYAYAGGAIAGPFLFNPPAALAHGPQSEACAAVAGGANWGGCNVWTSVDGTNYQQVGTIDQPARFGFAKAGFAAGADPDTTDGLQVDIGMSAGTLSGGSTADADAAATLALLDNELIAYSAATLTAQGRYALGGYIRRGVMGTAIAAHAAGAPFVRMDEGVFSFPYIAAQAGRQVYVKFQSFNHWGEGLQDLSVCNPYLITLDPVGTGSGVSASANRICFSEFEHGANDGWFTGYNPAGLPITRSSGVYQGVPFNQMTTTSTAPGQVVSQKSIAFPVTGGERLAVIAGLQSFTGWTSYAAIGFLDATGASISESEVGAVLASPGFDTRVQGFIQVPPTAVSAWFEAYATSTAASQALTFALSRPMVCGAAAEQTTFPAFSKGPAAEYGADVTGDWTAAAIAGQAGAATDTTIQSGATRNVVTVGATAPTSPSSFDLWNDTSVPPGLWKTWNGGSWTTVSIGGVFNANMYETAGGSVATLANFKTVLGTAAAITGQSPWATSGIPTSILTNPAANLVYNPAGALGLQDWAVAASSLGAVTFGGANTSGTYFYNASSTNATGCQFYQDIPCFAGLAYSLSAALYSGNLSGTGAQVRCYLGWLNSGGTLISYSAVCALAPGNGWTTVQEPNMTAPAGAATARVYCDIWGPGAWTNSGGACAWSQIKLEQNSACTPYSDETTNGALYRDGNTIDYWKPAQAGADVTGLNVAAGITGQAPAATDGTIQPGATYNAIYISNTDPTSGGVTVADGAFWFQPSLDAGYVRQASAWVIVTGQDAEGQVIFSAAQSGSVTTWSFTVPQNALGYVTATINGGQGGTYKPATSDIPGGGGGECVKHFAVTPGATVLSGSLGTPGAGGPFPTGGAVTTLVCSTNGSIAMTANGGAGATATGGGAGGSASGGDTNTTGTTGGASYPAFGGVVQIITHGS